MTDKKRVLSGLLISLAVLAAIGIGLGAVSGQILSEESYYEENFTQYNESAVQLTADDNLQNQHLINQDTWNQNYNSINRDWDHSPQYGSSDNQRRSWADFDQSKPWLQAEWEGDSYGEVGMYKELEVPDGMTNPVLVVEHAHSNQETNDPRHELAIWDADRNTGQLYTTRPYDSNPGWIASRAYTHNDAIRDELSKDSEMDRTHRQTWKTHMFDVSGEADNVTLIKANRMSSGDNNEESFVMLRQVYWVNAGQDAFQTEVNGFESVPEDDSFGGPDPYDLKLINEPTAEGEQTSLRSDASAITRDFQLDGISDAQKSYFVMEGTSQSQHPVEYTIEAYGQEVASGTIDPYSSSEETVELDLNTDEVTVRFDSEGQYDIHNVQFTALEETSQGDPLAKNSNPGGITLNPDKGYDRTIGLFTAGLDLTTDTMLYVVMIAITIGFVVFSFTKSVRGQEFAQSLLFGAIIAGVVIVGVVPTMNLATWIFTGDVDRAPLADPALEAEPPTYYSTEFQDGTMHGWSYDNSRGTGSVRPVSVGETFELQFTGNGEDPGIIQHQEHISLGNSLDTGFVSIDGAAEGAAGYQDNPHEVTYNVRVYVTDDGTLDSSEMLDTSTNYVESGQSATELRNPVTSITEVRATIDGETRDLSSDFEIVDDDAGIIRYTGNQTLANNDTYSETLNNPDITFETHNNGASNENMGTMEPGDTYEVSKSETSEDIAKVEEVARSFDGETMANEKMVTFELDGEYVHTVLIVRGNRGDENPIGTLDSVRVGATTEGGSTEH
ncbi:hypothetical protein [Halosimplex pelagicum]|uniref:Uncharacterized protein n=1 Tax=Halosimplex pelagicum TaxID=869886 RepID=A0A7D5T594_9EURY|nr:hypothetical protein [Halosimplex pelagicum]QLH82168.1 hypothetical protein HZS54_11370 [Halosimplex pelagicum]